MPCLSSRQTSTPPPFAATRASHRHGTIIRDLADGSFTSLWCGKTRILESTSPELDSGFVQDSCCLQLYTMNCYPCGTPSLATPARRAHACVPTGSVTGHCPCMCVMPLNRHILSPYAYARLPLRLAQSLVPPKALRSCMPRHARGDLTSAGCVTARARGSSGRCGISRAKAAYSACRTTTPRRL